MPIFWVNLPTKSPGFSEKLLLNLKISQNFAIYVIMLNLPDMRYMRMSRRECAQHIKNMTILHDVSTKQMDLYYYYYR